jgi:hypothetical protein
MVLVDYSAFHPRIICHLTGYNIPIDQDIYAYLAKSYFQTENPNEYEIAQAKQITFRQLFGGVEEQYRHIKYLGRLHTFIDNSWDFFQQNGYIETPFFKRRITDKHITDPNPAKLFNYILQASEGEVALPALKRIAIMLCFKLTKPVLYTYDSILFDFHKEDGKATMQEIVDLMTDGGKYHIKTYIGDSYETLTPFKL